MSILINIFLYSAIGFAMVVGTYITITTLIIIYRTLKPITKVHNKKTIPQPCIEPIKTELPSAETYGIEFSKKFLSKLKNNRICCNAHPYSYGTGFELITDSEIVFGNFHEGFLDGKPLHQFDDFELFVNWLSKQSDLSLSSGRIDDINRSRMS